MALTFSIDGEATDIEIVRRRPRLVLQHRTSRIRGGRRSPLGSAPSYARSTARRRFRRRARWRRRLRSARGRRPGGCRRSIPGEAAGGLAESLDEIRAPMPGVIVSVHKAEGDAVRRGEAIVTIESMKLQMALAGAARRNHRATSQKSRRDRRQGRDRRDPRRRRRRGVDHAQDSICDQHAIGRIPPQLRA